MRRIARASTIARQQRSLQSRERALNALLDGRTLLVSNRTTQGTVHAGLARRLVREGRAEYLPLPEGGRDMTRIRRNDA